MCPSALYIVQERIYFGERAFIVRANHGADSRRLFESPKHFISALNQQLLETPAHEAEDPTQRFTRAHLLLLLLGFILFRFDRALRAEGIAQGRVPFLRIARPSSWQPRPSNARVSMRLVVPGDKIDHRDISLLAVPMAAPDPLFDSLWVPRQVVVDDGFANLQVQSFCAVLLSYD